MAKKLQKSDNYSDFFNNLIDICDYNNTSPTTLAERFAHKSTLTAWKNGKIDTNLIPRLASELNVTIEQLITGKEKSPKLSTDEQELLNYYKILPDSEKNKLLGRASALAEIYGNADRQTEQKPRMARIAAYGQGTMDIPAAAPLTEEELKHFFPDEK